MGCGNSKPGQGKTTAPNSKVVSNQSQVQTNKSGITQSTMNPNAWDHPAPMKSPYPQGKIDEVLTRMKDDDLIIADNVPVAAEVVDEQMNGKIVKETYAIQNGYAYHRLEGEQVKYAN